MGDRGSGTASGFGPRRTEEEISTRLHRRLALETPSSHSERLAPPWGSYWGLAGGFTRGSGRRAILAAVIGVLLGDVTGAGTARVLVAVSTPNLKADDLTYPLLVHVGALGLVGAAAGLAFGLGSGDWRRSIRVMAGSVLRRGSCSRRLRVRGGNFTSRTDGPSCSGHSRKPARGTFAHRGFPSPSALHGGRTDGKRSSSDGLYR